MQVLNLLSSHSLERCLGYVEAEQFLYEAGRKIVWNIDITCTYLPLIPAVAYLPRSVVDVCPSSHTAVTGYDTTVID